MKVWILLAAFAVAFTGILSQHGRANFVSYASVVPLVVVGIVLLIKAIGK